MNSIGVSPYVNYLYTDLRNGRVLLDVNISFFLNSYTVESPVAATSPQRLGFQNIKFPNQITILKNHL